MPTAPVYRPNQVRTRALDTSALQPLQGSAFGGSVGQAMSGLGKAVGDAAAVQQQILDQQAETRTRETAVELGSRLNAELYGPQGLMLKDGRQFIDSVEPTQKRLEAIRKEYLQRGSNALERRMIADVVEREFQPAMNGITRQHVKAVDTENKASASSLIANLGDRLVSVTGVDPEATSRTRSQLDAALADEARIYGYDPQTSEQRRRQVLSRTHVYAIGKLLDEDPDAAEKALEAAVASGEITADTQVSLRKAVNDGKMEVAAGNFAMELATQGTVDLSGPEQFTPPLDEMPDASSTYGMRSDPHTGERKMHTGQDLPAPMGSPVKATAPGKVIFAGNKGGYGLRVEVDHGDGVITTYSHLSAANVKVGDTVPAGKAIAAVGSSGKSTGPHLHYELIRGGQKVDPSKPGAPPAASKRVELTPESINAYALKASGGNPVLYKRLRAEGMTEYNSRKVIEREREEKLYEMAWSQIEGASSTRVVKRSVWNSLTPQQRITLENYAESNAKGSEVETDMGHYGDLMTLQADDPKAFANYSFETDPKLSMADRRALIGQRTTVRKDMNNPEKSAKQTSLEVTNRIAGIAKPTNMKKEQESAFKGALFRAVASTEQATGKPMTEAEILTLAGSLSVDATVGQGMFGAKKAPLYTQMPGSDPKRRPTIDQVPQNVRQDMVRQFAQANGRLPTADELVTRYVTLRAQGKVQ